MPPKFVSIFQRQIIRSSNITSILLASGFGHDLSHSCCAMIRFRFSFFFFFVIHFSAFAAFISARQTVQKIFAALSCAFPA